MKIVKVSNNKCVASGGCTLLSDLLEEGLDGKAVPVGSGKISDSAAETFQEVINHCPVGAIYLEDSGLVKSSGVEGLNELKELIKKQLVDYNVSRPSREIGRYSGSASSIQYISSEGHHRYDYKSDSQAESAGLNHFDRVAYSQRRALVQQALVEFKINQLGDFIKYEEKPGNYYNEINNPLINLIKDIIQEIIEKTESKESVSVNLDRLKIGPDHKEKDEFYIYRLRNIETIFTESIVNKLDSLSSYRLYINTDDMEDYRGKDLYCYDLHEVIQQFRGDLADAIKDVFNYEDALEAEIKWVYERYSGFLKEELNDIANYLIKVIDSFLVEVNQTNTMNVKKSNELRKDSQLLITSSALIENNPQSKNRGEIKMNNKKEIIKDLKQQLKDGTELSYDDYTTIKLANGLLCAYVEGEFERNLDIDEVAKMIEEIAEEILNKQEKLKSVEVFLNS